VSVQPALQLFSTHFASIRSGFFILAQRAELAGSGAPATAAGGLILPDVSGISNIGATQIGWRGGEITFQIFSYEN
jgi:hypothetical protein